MRTSETHLGLGPEDDASGGGDEAGVLEGGGDRRGAHGDAVHALDLESSDASGAHDLRERADPVDVVDVEREHVVAARVEERDGRAVVEHHEAAGTPGRSGQAHVVVAAVDVGELGPGQRGAVRLGRIGGREHEELGVARGLRVARSRSAAPGSANCAAPSPATK